MSSALVRCRYRCSQRHRLGRGGRVEVGADEAVGVDGGILFQVGDRQARAGPGEGAAAPRPGVGGDLLGVQPRPADEQHGVFGQVRRLVWRDCDLRVLHASRVPPGVLGDPGPSAFHMLVIRLAPIAKGHALGRRRRGPAPRRSSPASARSGILHPAAAAPSRTDHGSAASARASSPTTDKRGSSSPGRSSAASGISVSAQDATCGRPARCPW